MVLEGEGVQKLNSEAGYRKFGQLNKVKETKDYSEINLGIPSFIY